MSEHPRFRALLDAGQSVWLDYIDRRMFADGSLHRLIGEGLRGMTSNPTIFEKALAESTAYDEQVLGAPAELSPLALFELVETQDVREACDAFLPIFRASGGGDGYVSIEVSPGVADDATGTVEEARRLWAAVGRPNVMVKVPGTAEGAVAVRQLIADGINVNVTLLFSLAAYARVIEAYLAGLEARVALGQAIDGIASVASFFVSRVDSEIDKRLDAMGDAEARGLKGQAAVANARLAYRLFARQFAGPRWDRLQSASARVQRPLWASTSTKNPAYRDVLYVETLIGPHTVNTMPPATIDAFRDHGEVARTVDTGYGAADALIAALDARGISMEHVTDKLLMEGLASFQKSFDSLLAGLERKRAALGSSV